MRIRVAPPFVLTLALAAWITHRLDRSASPTTALVFAPGVISLGNVYRGSFSPDGKELYFFKKIHPDREDYRIFLSRWEPLGWTSPQQLVLGGEHSDLYPGISPDGERMVFSSYRPVPGAAPEERNANLWMSTRQGEHWSEPELLSIASQMPYYHSQPYFATDGSVYFKRVSPDWSSQQHLVTRWNGRSYEAPVVAEAIARWEKWRDNVRFWEGTFGPDQSFIILTVSLIDPATRRPGHADLWITERHGTEWSLPRPLSAGVNTESTENFPFFSPDGRDLFFVRDFNDFYRVSLSAARSVSLPVN